MPFALVALLAPVSMTVALEKVVARGLAFR